VMALAFSPDGKTLASSGDKVVRLWDVRSGKQLDVFAAGGQTHSLAFSPDGKTLAVARREDAVRLYDVPTGKEVRRVPEKAVVVYSIAFSPDGRLLITGTIDKAVRLWDVASGKVLREFVGDHNGRFWGVAVSPDGKLIAGASEGSRVYVWDAKT